MKSIFLFISILIFATNGFSQTIESKQGIQAQFSSKNIAAYQSNSHSMILEFYDYASKYSQTKDDKLKKQIQSNLESLVQNNSIKIPNFENQSTSYQNLDEFLASIEYKNWKFEVNEIKSSSNIQLDHWINSYTLKVEQGKKTFKETIQQTIYFTPIQKKFGTKTKTVWALKLGTIDIH